MSPLAWMFLAGWLGRSALARIGRSLVADVITLLASLYALYLGLQ